MLKYLRITVINFALAAILVAGAALPAQAAFIDLTGFVNSAADPNFWGITTDSPVTGTATWDESLLVGDGEEVLVNYDSTGFGDFIDLIMNLEITIGNFSYNFFNDTSASELTFGFMDGFLKNIKLFGEGPDFSPFDIAYDFPDYANVFSINGGEVTGEIAPVPEPGTFLLLGAGLGGLIYVQRRRKNG
ncbi:MAG: PEP-CTERM sorting domain-containing protein [Desulfobulbaceae bacterium]